MSESSPSSSATIIRYACREDTFARVPHDLLDNPKLSWKAKGILAYLLGKPDGWVVQVEDIKNRGSDGETAVRSGLKELRDAGYAKLECHREEGTGRVIGWTFKLSDSPVFLSRNPDDSNPDMGNPDVGSPVQENQYLSKKETSSKNESSKNEIRGRFVKPTLEQLKTEFKARIDTLSEFHKSWFKPEDEAEGFLNFYESNGWKVGKNKMVSWPHAVTNWMRTWKGRHPEGKQAPSNRPPSIMDKKSQRDVLREQINKHPANRNSAYCTGRWTQEQAEDFAKKKAMFKQLEEEIISAGQQ